MSTTNKWTYPISIREAAGSPILQVKLIIKIPGKLKHEMGSRIIEEFVALTPKTYSFKDYPNQTKEKGI